MDRQTLAAIGSHETGPLGIPHLRRLWARTRIGTMGGDASPDADELLLDRIVYDSLGMGMTDTLTFLYRPDLSYEEFEGWITSLYGGSVPQERIDRTRDQLQVALGDTPPAELAARGEPAGEEVLGPADLDFFEEHGYVVLHDAVSAGACRAAEQAIWDALGASPDDRDSWYSAGLELRRKVMVELYRHPALEANRVAPRIHRAFAQLWETDALCYTTDRAGFSPPDRPGYAFSGPPLHWDVHFQVPMPFALQGILYLTDTPTEQGAFRCVSGFHRRMNAWLEALPEGADPQAQDLDALGPQPIAGRAGDLVIWHHCLPHGPSPNRGVLPRIVQYVNMYPYHRKLGRQY